MILYLAIALILSSNPELPHSKITPAKVVILPSLDRINATTDAGDLFSMKTFVINSPKYGKKIVKVDDEDFEKVNKITWTLQRHHDKFIACGWIGLRTVKLHRYISNIHDKEKSKIRLIHVDGDNFNNQKSNLRIITPPKFILYKNHVELILDTLDYGIKPVIFDREYLPIIKNYTWRIVQGGHGVFYASSFESNTYDSVRMHRLIMGFPRNHVDHKNRNGLDNRKRNLRVATQSQNMMNSIEKRINNTTGFKGVFRQSNKKTYYAQIGIGGGVIYGGTFQTTIEAAKRYNELAIKYHGKFARLNHIPS